MDLRSGGSQDRTARVEFAGRSDLVSAVALIASSPLSQTLGNLFVSVSKPSYPTRLFDDEASATAWLHEAAG